MSQFFTLTVIGICAGGTFAIAASGLVLTYTTTGIFNFGHGAIAMLGAFAYWQLRSPQAWGLPAPLALFLVLFVLAPLFGVLLEVGIMRRLQGASETAKLVVTISLLAGLLELGRWIWPEDGEYPINRFFEGHVLSFFGVRITWHEAIAFGLAVLVAIGLRILLYRTRAGIAMRASVDDRPLAALHGARPDRSAMLAWAIGCSLAALAGILTAPLQVLSHELLTLLIVNAYAAAIFGRLRSLPMTFLGALILGLADAYATGYIPTTNQYVSQMRPALPVLILFVVLLVLPGSRLRGHTPLRSREVAARPNWIPTLLSGAALIVGTGIVAHAVSEADAQSLGALFGIALIAASLIPLIGFAGQVSLCPMSFAAIGALAMGYHGGGGNAVGLVFAAVIAGLVGALVALPALRLSGIYLALSTAAFAVVLDRWIFLIPNVPLGPWTIKLFGSSNLGVSAMHLPFVDTNQPRTQLVMLSAVFVVFWLLIVAIRRSSFGERLLAMKDSPAACATLGMNVTMTKLAVFSLSAAMAGVGGAFYAATLGGVASSNFDFFSSLPIVLLVVVGGVTSAGGALFTGITQILLPMVAAPFTFLASPLKLLPGTLGVSLARMPNGVVGEVTEGFAPLRRQPAVIAGLVAVLAALAALQAADVISGWDAGLFAVAAVLGAGLAAKSRHEQQERRAAAEVDAAGVDATPLEWVGISRPYTPADVARIDAALALPGPD
ncbi:MAG TPA: ABC transporter permease [Acidimicrobiales bacterium]